MELRLFEPKDLPELTKIYIHTFKRVFEKYAPEKMLAELTENSPIVKEMQKELVDGDTFILSEDQVLGFSTLKIYNNYVELKLLFTSDDAHGKGVGARLLEHAKTYAQKFDKKELVIWTLADGGGKEFYKTQGAYETGKVSKWAGESEIVELRLTLE